MASEAPANPLPPRERPWLLPYNRKLRHLHGIAIRNLTLSPNPNHRRGRTIDDDAIPSTLKSPAKALALLEAKELHHSRSSSDLRPIDEFKSHAECLRPNNDAQAGSSTRMRRRSTAEWTGASPLQRQKKLEDVTANRMADTFFSLHVPEFEDPIYISEVIEKAMNPSFRFFELQSHAPHAARLDRLTIKVWAKTETVRDYQFLIELTTSLRSLQFIGKTLQTFHHPLPQNCVIFYLTDGAYASFTDIPMDESLSIFTNPPLKTATAHSLTTSSYDALMRLSTLDDCIQDALATRERLASEIESILKSNQESFSVVNKVPEAQEQARLVQSVVAAQRRRNEAAKKRRDELSASIAARRAQIQAGHEVQGRVRDHMDSAQERLKMCTDVLRNTDEDITGQRRRVCEDILTIFPIEPIPDEPLFFTIRGIPLPNSTFDSTDIDEDSLAAALGYVAQILHLLSYYLSLALPYPVQPRGSTSAIQDQISMTTGSRVYPLFMKGTIRYRFEYGVFLLNKDIEILANWIGLRLLDIRHTLPNLKYLLYVATAGEGELPARKAGGIRGLMRARAGAFQADEDSRRGSVDSRMSMDVVNYAARGALDVNASSSESSRAVPNGTQKPILALSRGESSQGFAANKRSLVI